MSDEFIEPKTDDAVRRGRPPKEPKTDDAVQDDVMVRRVAIAKQERKYFPVKLLRNYNPINDFLISGEPPSPEGRTKVFAGSAVDMDKDEAMDIIAKGIAVRNDPIN